MNKYIRYFLLLVPLLCFFQIWCSLVFDIELPISFPYFFLGGDNPGLMDAIWTIIIIIFSFFIGSIYTARKKLWGWFTCYMLLGGVPIIIFLFGFIIG
ncbi:hypothetical protein [Aliivibrio fischeri]|uniref:hypothetical protein n=1 Tax=Aliivibrio fischeri TaxID=668 RepID=UPI00105C9873|nr:hypothetical protein [Aliivibrio fischeri]MUJ21978.1 hypothetical protein [Aliivibrio fischeri]TDM51451.1 hypothetical protein VFFQA001_15150 [Aliivibrio fischeri]